MKATKIQYKDGSLVPKHALQMACDEIILRAGLKGFITDASVESDSRIDIGLHMRSFRIDVNRIGHNARLNTSYGAKSPKGYKRTDVPTWDQRVVFNALVNSVFTKANIQALIISGNYTVRTLEGGAVKSWPEGGDRAENCGFSGTASADIMTESDARAVCNSDALEAQHKEASKAERNAAAAHYRAHVKELKAAPFVAFYTGKYKNGRVQKTLQVMTMVEFSEFNAKQDYRKIKMTDLKPAHGDTKTAARNVILVLERLNQAKGG